MHDAPQQPTTLLIVGDAPDAALTLPAGLSARVARCIDLDDAQRVIQTLWQSGAVQQDAPHLIVLGEARPGQFPPEALARFRRRFPLARFVRVQGAWCEGAAREALVTHGCWQAYEHQWPARLMRELARRNSHWALPATTSREEQLAVASQNWPSASPARSIALCAASAEASAALGAVCRRAGYSTLETPSSATFRLGGVAAVVWDATVREITDPARVTALVERAGGAPVIAVTGFPRPDDLARARAAGLAAVVAKPFLASDLLWQIEQHCVARASY